MFTWETIDIPSNVVIALSLVAFIIGYVSRVVVDTINKIREDE